MKQFARDVWSLISTPDPHTFLINTDGKWVLIDAGYPWQAKRLLREIQTMTKHLDGILLTHHDLDHIGALGLLQREMGAPVYVHSLDRPFFDGARKLPARKNTMGKVAGLFSRRPKDIRLLEDSPFEHIQAVWMPGHTPGHTIFQYRDLVFAGDMFFNRAGRGLENLWQYHGDFQQTADSLEQLAAIQNVTWVPSHGVPLAASPESSESLRQLAKELRAGRPSA